MKAIVLKTDTYQHVNALQSIGIEKAEWLEQILLRVLYAFNNTTKNDAITAAGTYAYLAAVRAKRDILGHHGWEPEIEHNLELTVNAEYGTRLIVSSGNEDTGIKDGFPATKNEKGKQTKKVVAVNAAQRHIWPELENYKNIQIKNTWILLYHIDLSKSKMRAELSLPVDLDINELKVNGWAKRIIIKPIEYNQIRIANDFDFKDDFEIKIERRNEG